VFMFEKKVAEKLHKPRRREAVTETLRNEVLFTSRLKHPSILRVVHPLEESRSVIVVELLIQSTVLQRPTSFSQLTNTHRPLLD